VNGPETVGAVFRRVVRHPWDAVLSRWNYKAAVLSAAVRSALFFLVNLSAGPEAAWGAAATEALFRLATAGFYGALTEAFRHAEPRATATLCVMVLLPTVAHSIELAVHWTRGTPALADSLAVSVVFTAISTAFNLFAMRQGALIVGNGRRSLLEDLLAMPRLLALFAVTVFRQCARPGL